MKNLLLTLVIIAGILVLMTIGYAIGTQFNPMKTITLTQEVATIPNMSIDKRGTVFYKYQDAIGVAPKNKYKIITRKPYIQLFKDYIVKTKRRAK